MCVCVCCLSVCPLQYMARSLGDSGSKSIVAVVGIGHLDGIESYLQSLYGFKYVFLDLLSLQVILGRT